MGGGRGGGGGDQQHLHQGRPDQDPRVGGGDRKAKKLTVAGEMLRGNLHEENNILRDFARIN